MIKLVHMMRGIASCFRGYLFKLSTSPPLNQKAATYPSQYTPIHLHLEVKDRGNGARKTFTDAHFSPSKAIDPIKIQ